METILEMNAIQDATRILLVTNKLNASGALVVWRILTRAQKHLDMRMSELLAR